MSAAPSQDQIPTFPDLAGKVAVVTGASKGIGAAACRYLAANGAKIAAVARDAAALSDFVTTLAPAVARPYAVDCTDGSAVRELAVAVERDLGPVEVVMAFAGGFVKPTPFLEITEQEWREVLDWNLTSSFLTLSAFLPAMAERGSGSLVMMTSCTGRMIDRTITASYAAAKGGIELLAQHAAREMAACNVRINCVAPATTLTERLERTMTPERLASIEELTPLGRLGRPEESAAAALFLASQASSYMTGVTLDVAGGRVML